MKERPILFSAPMVQAVLEDRKTQTRRIIKPQPDRLVDLGRGPIPYRGAAPPPEMPSAKMSVPIDCPYGFAGDRLWGRENYRLDVAYDGGKPTDAPPNAAVFYEAGGKVGDGVPGKQHPSIHMPRWATRLVLEVTEIRVQRLNDCSEADALAEGVVWSDRWQGFIVHGVEHPNRDFPVLARATAREMYAALWDVINGSGSWLSNPWIWAVTFKRILES